MRTLVLRTFVVAWLLLRAASAAFGQVQPADGPGIRAELDRLRLEFDALRQQYGDRLALLEKQLTDLEQAASPPAATETPTTSPPTQPVAPVPPGAAGAGGPDGSLPIYGNPAGLSKIFNPDLAVVGSFVGAAGRNPVQPLPPFEFQETETSIQGIVDPYARADFFFTIDPTGIDLEEGYVTFPALPGGLLVKAGKLRSAFGKVNAMHTHVLPWADRPLVAERLLGGEEGVSDVGVSVASLVPNPWLFLEATGEVYRAQSAVFQSDQPRDLSYVGHIRGYQDITESTNVDVGGSIAYGPNGAGPSATTRIIGLDGTFRYRPVRRALYQRLLARTEFVWSRRSEAGGQNAFGLYVAGDYQFARRWFGGMRYDYTGRATDPDTKDSGASWLVTFWPSEFSQVRTQYRRTRYAEGHTANEVLFQLLFSIGAHGAHAF